MAKTTQQPQEAIRILNLVEHSSVCLFAPYSGFRADDGPSEGCPHRAVKLDIRFLPFSESCAGAQTVPLYSPKLAPSRTLSRKSRELESVRTERGKNTPRSLVLKCVIATVWETASFSNEVSGRSFQMKK